MIISQTPVRISFGGGGTDLRPFYEVTPGAILGSAISKYVYIAVNRPIDETIRVSCLKTEVVNSVDEIEHSIVRKALEVMNLTNSIDVTSISDVPAGTGLGSSGSFTVGLLNALHAYKETFASQEQLAREACTLEIDLLGAPIGKQDQFLAAHGGLQYVEFNPDESVFVEPVICCSEVKHQLSSNLMLFYTGQAREASSILAKQHKETKEASKFELLSKMKEFALEMRRVLTLCTDLREFGELLHQEWLCKKRLMDNISNETIDTYYDKALTAGAIGGKIAGAGGGGFMLLYCEEDNQPKVREALHELREMDFSLEPRGSRIITVS